MWPTSQRLSRTRTPIIIRPTIKVKPTIPCRSGPWLCVDKGYIRARTRPLPLTLIAMWGPSLHAVLGARRRVYTPYPLLIPIAYIAISMIPIKASRP